ncbi:MAG: hypothetical protein HY297_05035 [Thaumarchaeota archaeon]|nr:hypothetical protein [Nitrososphaerota archaeon]
MVAPIVITILAYLHVTSAISWMGASLFFLVVLGPGLRGLSPPASLEFMAKVGGKAVRYFMGSATATIVFGLVLLYVVIDGDFSSLGTAGFGTTISIGFTIGFIAYLDAALLTGRKFTKANKLAIELMKNPPQGPPTELIQLMKEGGQGALIGTVLLFIAAVFMVTAGFPF